MKGNLQRWLVNVRSGTRFGAWTAVDPGTRIALHCICAFRTEKTGARKYPGVARTHSLLPGRSDTEPLGKSEGSADVIECELIRSRGFGLE